LYAGLLLKQDKPSREVTVYDRNPPDATYGWGVVFSDETLAFLQDADPNTYEAIAQAFVRWEAIDIFYRDQRITSGGHAFSGLSRSRLLHILQSRCRDVGVALHFEQEVAVDDLQDASLVVVADGMNSRIRQADAAVFKPSFDVHPTRYIWLGVPLRFEAFTFVFRMTEHGMFQVHAYPYDREMSTFIVECAESTWRRAGLDRAEEKDSLAFCEKLFSDVIGGRSLLSNRSTWINFVTLRNETWRHRNRVLLGDAAHTAHFSIGSGTKMALEDAIALQQMLRRQPNLKAALIDYEEIRQARVERTQQAARDSSRWFENTGRYAGFDPLQFAFSLLTRSTRITYDNLELRDASFIRKVDRWFAANTGLEARTDAGACPEPLDTPFTLASMSLRNRLVATAGSDLRAAQGSSTSRGGEELAELARRCGLIRTTMVAVSDDGRVAPDTPVLAARSQVDAWKRSVDRVHAAFGACLALQLGHAGARGAVRSRDAGIDLPLTSGAWHLLAASAIPYARYGQVPRAMNHTDMDRVCADFGRAGRLAAEAGVDVLELQFGHGYLVAGFLSPLTNSRADEYGGSLENRMRFPLRVLDEVRRSWPADRPLVVCFSATDWHAGGISREDAVLAAGLFRDHGCSLIHVASGQTVFDASPPYGALWQAQLADQIRNDAHVPTMVGGEISSRDEVNTLLASGRADLCVISREL
jgi:anthraniloyl-CoA monooxygenase